jgi:hypothetical protein
MPITLLVPLLGADAARINSSASEHRAGNRALASARPAVHIHSSLCQTHGDIGRDADRGTSRRASVAARSAAV